MTRGVINVVHFLSSGTAFSGPIGPEKAVPLLKKWTTLITPRVMAYGLVRQ